MNVSVVLISITCVFAITQTAFSHPGGLDENGGHVNKKTGVYHYHSKKKKDNKKKPQPAPKKTATFKKTTPKKPLEKTKSEKSVKKPTPVMSEDEPDFSIFDKLTAENEAHSKKKKPSKQLVPKKNLLPKFQVLKTERSNSKAIIYVQLLDTKAVPTDRELLQLSRKLDSGHRYLIYFFLPTMKSNGSPWAIALETTTKTLEISRFDKRAPKSFQPLLKQKKPKLEEVDD